MHTILVPFTRTYLTPFTHTNLTLFLTVFRQAKASLFFSESPTNPYLRCIDIPAIGAACKQAGTVLAIDSTFATPINQKPLELGADLVVHSATKYIAGVCVSSIGSSL